MDYQKELYNKLLTDLPGEDEISVLHGMAIVQAIDRLTATVEKLARVIAKMAPATMYDE